METPLSFPFVDVAESYNIFLRYGTVDLPGRPAWMWHPYLRRSFDAYT